MKKLIIFSLVSILCLLFIFNTNSFASGVAIYEYFKNGTDTELNIPDMASAVYLILKTFAVILAVCIITTIAISYMISSPQKRGMLKERLIYYFIGVIFLLGGVAFLNWYEGLAKKAGDVFANGTSYEQSQSNGVGVNSVGPNAGSGINAGPGNRPANVTNELR